jgi:hypothetical protein
MTEPKQIDEGTRLPFGEVGRAHVRAQFVEKRRQFERAGAR